MRLGREWHDLDGDARALWEAIAHPRGPALEAVMPAGPDQPTDTHVEQADLQKLAAELALLNYQAHLVTPAGRLPYLHVRNPRSKHLTENVYAQAGTYFWPWAEPVAGCDQVAKAAALVARVLRTVDDQ